MSLEQHVTIECPQCHQTGKMLIWQSMNVTLDPDLRDKIFTEEIFQYNCPHCGATIPVSYSFLYHDMLREIMITVYTQKPEGYKYEPSQTEKKLGLADTYTTRIVFGIMRLQEKILILEQGLSDVAIEYQKYLIKYVANPEMAEKGYEIYFERFIEPCDQFPRGLIRYLYFDEDDQPSYLEYDADLYIESDLFCNQNPNLRVTDTICIDEEWIRLQLEGESSDR